MLRIKANIRLQDGQRPTRAAGTALGQQRAFRMSSGRREDREPRNDLGQRAHLYVILTTGATATGGTDLGQVRVREPGTGFRKSRSAPAPQAWLHELLRLTLARLACYPYAMDDVHNSKPQLML